MPLPASRTARTACSRGRMNASQVERLPGASICRDYSHKEIVPEANSIHKPQWLPKPLSTVILSKFY
ncbi:MAG TPA: hypothetical protein V6D03_02810 [Candidatus Caenarcaniphilales bacterium]